MGEIYINNASYDTIAPIEDERVENVIDKQNRINDHIQKSLHKSKWKYHHKVQRRYRGYSRKYL